MEMPIKMDALGVPGGTTDTTQSDADEWMWLEKLNGGKELFH